MENIEQALLELNRIMETHPEVVNIGNTPVTRAFGELKALQDAGVSVQFQQVTEYTVKTKRGTRRAKKA
jgi:hypothetical protein